MDDWNAGDLALCVKKGDIIHPGEILRVSRVGTRPDGRRGLWFVEYEHLYVANPIYGQCGSSAKRFVKINPLSEDEEREFFAELGQEHKRLRETI